MAQEVDKGKRRLLAGAVKLAGAGAVISTLSSAELAYAAVNKIADFRHRIGNRDSGNSAFYNHQATTMATSHGEPITVQVSPTPNLQATKTALDIKSEELTIQKQQTDNTFAFVADIVAPVGTAVAVGTLAYTILRGQIDQRAQETRRRDDQGVDREKRDEDRFQKVVENLGSKDIEARTGAAIMLRTFLDPKYKESYQRFYQQIFDLAVAHLRLRKVEPDNPHPDSLNQALIILFKETTPLLVDSLLEIKGIDLKYLSTSDDLRKFDDAQRKYLDASGIRLDGAYLQDSYLNYINLEEAFLIRANLDGAHLNKAYLAGADLSGANLFITRLYKANLYRAHLNNAILSPAILTRSHLTEADLTEADLTGANLQGANPEDALSLKNTKMYDIVGFDDSDKRQQCKDKGAIFDRPPSAPSTRGETK